MSYAEQSEELSRLQAEVDKYKRSAATWQSKFDTMSEEMLKAMVRATSSKNVARMLDMVIREEEQRLW
jgi:hypothetical protein